MVFERTESICDEIFAVTREVQDFFKIYGFHIKTGVLEGADSIFDEILAVSSFSRGEEKLDFCKIRGYLVLK